ncbi:MAG: hypothetical protein ABEJ93_04515 [Candidatus Nanohalobium sp.]
MESWISSVDAEYRVIEIQGDNLEVHDEAVEPECPELGEKQS